MAWPSLLFLAAIALALPYNGGSDLRFYGASLLVLTIGVAAAAWTQGSSTRLTRHGSLLLLGFFVCWALASTLWSVAPGVTLLSVPIFFALLGAFLFGLWSKPDDGLRVVIAASVFGLVAGAAILYEAFWLSEARPGGFLLNSNSTAALLNLLLLPIIGAALNEQVRWRLVSLIAIIWTLAFAEAVTISRGGLVGLVVALTVFSVVVRGRWLRFGAILGTLLCAFLVGSLFSEGNAFARLAAGVHAQDANSFLSYRVMIWDGAWQMYLQHPFLGWGYDTFWLGYPAVRDPLEISAGQRVHNDYLQLLLELGPLGLALFSAFLASLAHLAWKLVRSDGPLGLRAEQAALAAGIAAVAVHSTVDFHFYQMTILLGLGFYAGRLLSFAPGHFVSPFAKATVRSWRLGVVTVFLLPFVWLAGLEMSELTLARVPAAANLGEAIRLVEEAGRFYPSRDGHHLFLAFQVEKVLREQTGVDPAERQRLVELGLAELDQGLVYNPLSTDNRLARALLMQQDPARFTAAQVRSPLESALALDPGLAPARMRLALSWQEEGQPAKANEVLEAGWRRVYYGEIAIAGRYARMLAASRASLGDEAGARRAEAEAERLKAIISERHFWIASTFLGENEL